MIKRILPGELRAGMYVCGMEKEAGKPLFFMNNILLKAQVDIEKMARNGYACIYVTVEDAPPAPVPRTTAPATETEIAVEAEPLEPIELEAVLEPAEEIPAGEVLENTSPAWQEIPEEIIDAAEVAIVELIEEVLPEEAPFLADTGFDEELKEAKRVRDDAEVLVREFLQSVKLGKEIDTVKVVGTVGRMVDSVFRNMDALTSLARLKSFDDYTFAHCVNVSILSITLGRQMGLERSDLEELGTGAILHDIGKVLVPEKVLNKPGKLTDEEFTIIKRHPEYAGEVLTGSKIKEGSRLVAMQHHERYDGSGYHKGFAKGDIHIFARIAAVADVYDAMTSHRVYQRGLVPEEALKKLYLMRGTHFEPEIVERLIKCLGIYPIGTFVELNTGELAVVKMVNRSHPMQPIIQLLSDRAKKPRKTPEEADLKDEIGRWIVATRRPEEFAPLPETIAS